MRTWHIKDASFPEDIKARGLEGTSTLPHYPWRDDGMLVWTAIHSFVASYLQHFYPSDEDLRRDSEVQVQLPAGILRLLDGTNCDGSTFWCTGCNWCLIGVALVAWDNGTHLK